MIEISILIDLIIERMCHIEINKAAAIIRNQITLSLKYTRSTASKRFVSFSLSSSVYSFKVQFANNRHSKKKEKKTFSTR